MVFQLMVEDFASVKVLSTSLSLLVYLAPRQLVRKKEGIGWISDLREGVAQAGSRELLVMVGS